MKYIDLRSDTVTQPTKAMRDAMHVAVVGDDVYMDDPTVTQLETLAAGVLGKPAAIFVSSGTMGNQLSIMAATKRGDEIIVGETYHIYEHEVGAVAVLSGVNMRTMPYKDGMPDPKAIELAIRGEDIHFPKTSMICLENALGNGRVVPVKRVNEIYKLAKKNKIHLHIDGARIFNACTAAGCDVKDFTKNCNSISVCLSKGLCAPVGSIIAGERDFIDRVRKYRKMVGGGMRQAGFLAAAGIIAINDMTKRLEEDHKNAKYLAQKLSEIDGIKVDKSSVEINMIFFKIDRPEKFLDTLPAVFMKKNVKINEHTHGEFRFVTSNDVKKADIDTVIDILIDVLSK